MDACIFWGGADVNPELYGEKNTKSSIDRYQDEADAALYKFAKSRNAACIGVCRGAQFLWVVSGGRLVQDLGIASHDLTHPVSGQSFTVNSFHHQGIVGDAEGIEILAMHKGVVEAYYGENKDGVLVFGVQWHPEYVKDGEEFRDWWKKRVDSILGEEGRVLNAGYEAL